MYDPDGGQDWDIFVYAGKTLLRPGSLDKVSNGGILGSELVGME